MTSRRPLLVLVAGLLLTLAGTLLARWDVQNDAQERLDERADRVTAVLELELERYRASSRAVAALRADDPTQAEWLEEVERLEIAADLASVFSIASATLGEDGPTRTLKIDLVAPFEPNEAALGLDLLATPAAAIAATRALDDERVSLSDALTLVQEPGDQSGLVVYAPWYREDGTVGGVTDLVMRGQDLLDALVEEIGALGLVVTDPDTVNGRREVGRLVPAAGLDESMTTTRRLVVQGQEWELAFTAPNGFLSTTERLGTWLTLAGLLAVTLLVTALVSVLQRREEHALEEVRLRTAELVEANEELELALAAKEEFLSVVTHEFRTPITVIRGFAETAATGRAGDLSEQAQQWLDRIDRHARRLHVLMDNVLTTARLQSGELTIEPEVVDVARLTEAVVAQHSHLAPLHLDVDEGLLVEVDPAHYVRILDALLSNADKYGRPPVFVSAVAEGDDVVVTVVDSGDGVPAPIAPRIFAPFEQADQGERREARGMGLGLAIVNQLCEQMGGAVRLCPDDSGARFEVRLPRVSAGRGGGAAAVASAATTTDEG